MRILYLHQYFSTPKGSTSTRSYEMARKLILHGHNVIMVCGSNKGSNTGLSDAFKRGFRRGIVDGIEVIEVNCNYNNGMSLFRRTISFLKFTCYAIFIALFEKYDRIFATSTPLTIAIPGIASRWLRRKPFIFEVRDLWPEAPKAMGVIRNPIILGCMSCLEWLSYHSATRLIALSPRMVDGIVLRGIPRERVKMIPNGCDLDLFGSAATPWLPKYISSNCFLAIFTGAHGIANGLDAVLDAARVLKSLGDENIHILFVGDGKMKPELIKRANRDSLTNVSFHEPISKERLSGLMKCADVGLQVLMNTPAFYNGSSPNKFFDYLASGLPVINNYPGWIANMIEENNCGRIAPPEDPAAFAEILIKMSSCQDKLREMAINARRLAEDKFDRNKLSEQFSAWITDKSVS